MTVLTRYVVLLRAVNLGARKAPMAALRAACERAGFLHVRSYIASGNLVVSTGLARDAVEAALEEIIARDFGFHSDAIVRSLAEWRRLIETAPFAAARGERPNQINLCLPKCPPDPSAPETLAARATLGERVVLVDEALWIDFAGGVGESKITPALLDRAAGCPVTARNWNTVFKLLELAQESTGA